MTQPSVARLREAGALILGKTNLDQFATGLVGVRTPYGIGRNLFNPKLIPGGSSTGSALAVGAGLVPLALGTDTAGSGRVPAAFNNIVGLKPSRGLVSTAGVVPACRTLDCVSVFALTVDDAVAGARRNRWPRHGRSIFTVISARVRPDRYQMRCGSAFRLRVSGFSSAISNRPQLTTGRLFASPILGQKSSTSTSSRSMRPRRLLYDGPWITERYLAVKDLIASEPESMHPVTRQIILAGAHGTAADVSRRFISSRSCGG